MSKPANHCDECKHFCTYDEDPEGSPVRPSETCRKGHRPKFYNPTSPVDTNWGYKRRCSDFTPQPPPSESERSLLNKLFDKLFPWRL